MGEIICGAHQENSTGAWSIKSIQSYFLVIIIILWNISILMDMISPCSQSTRRLWVWWLWKWYGLYAMAFTDTRSQLNTNGRPSSTPGTKKLFRRLMVFQHFVKTHQFLTSNLKIVLSYANKLASSVCAVPKVPKNWESCKLLVWNRYLIPFFGTLDSANTITRQIQIWCWTVVSCSFMCIFCVCIMCPQFLVRGRQDSNIINCIKELDFLLFSTSEWRWEGRREDNSATGLRRALMFCPFLNGLIIFSLYKSH